MEDKKMKLGVSAAILALLVSLGFYAYKNKPTPEAVEMAKESSSTTNASAKTYKDGDYTAVGTYRTPNGSEKLGVKVTLKNQVVTAVEVEQLAVAPGSKFFQADFAKNYKEFVVGKNISELKLSKISGSSLTPKGFNDAIEKIKTEARS
jgi:uncharacterized protein with FMN-binding domain